MDARNLTEKERHRLAMAAADRRDWCTQMLRWMDKKEWDQFSPEYQILITTRHSLQALVNSLGMSGKCPLDPPKPEAVDPVKQVRDELPPAE